MHRFALIIAILTAVSCSAEPEEMVRVYSPEDHEKFLRILVEEKIPHRVNEHDQIWYPVSYREEIQKIDERIWGPIDESKKGVRVGSNVATELASALSKEEISFEVHHQDGNSTFTWHSSVDDSATRVVNGVLLENGT